MKKELFVHVLNELYRDGYADEIDWQRNLKLVSTVEDFCAEAAWVILNSGMKEQIARQIWNRIKLAWANGAATNTAFGHAGKVAAIDYINANGHRLFNEYKAAPEKVSYLQTLPFIGPITCYHLAKNYGEDVVKPDRHLVRIAAFYKTTPGNLCAELSKSTGEKVCVVDLVLWRGANLGILSNDFLIGYEQIKYK